jgi:hypothetical protein
LLVEDYEKEPRLLLTVLFKEGRVLGALGVAVGKARGAQAPPDDRRDCVRGRNTDFTPEFLEDDKAVGAGIADSGLSPLAEGGADLLLPEEIVLCDEVFLDVELIGLEDVGGEDGVLAGACHGFGAGGGVLDVLLLLNLLKHPDFLFKFIGHKSVLLDFMVPNLRPVDFVLQHPPHRRLAQKRPCQNEQIHEIGDKRPQVLQHRHLL